MNARKHLIAIVSGVLLGAVSTAHAAPVNYQIDPSHTYPSFEADHMGVSIWRGKFTKSVGKITLDKVAGSGFVSVTVDTDSIDFGHKQLNSVARGTEIMDVAQYPYAAYSGQLQGFSNGAPTQVVGQLTLHGVTKPLVLQINRFKCAPHPLFKREVCGADALATFNRADFGIDTGKSMGFDMNVTLRIQVEAIQGD